MNRFQLQCHLCFALYFFLSLTACSASSPTPTSVAEVMAEATDTPILPTDTPIPTDTPTPPNTPTPTATATPSDTPMPTPTNTPEPTNTPTPTETPEPTNTAEPTATPEPTATAVPPTDTPAAATAAPTSESGDGENEDEEQEYITFFYISNPAEVLGVFPVLPFDAEGLRVSMSIVQGSLNAMRNNLDGAHNGDQAACDAYVSAYNNILYSGIYFEPVPPEWQEIDGIYYLSFIYSLDRTRPAYLSCANAGRVDDFNYGLALQTIEETLGILNPAVARAYSQ